MVNYRLSIVLTLLVFCGCGFGSGDGKPEQTGPTGPFAILFDIDGEMPQFSSPAGGLRPPTVSQYRLTELLEKATGDYRVQEIVVHIGTPELSLARAQELVDALLRVSLAGKPLFCHVDATDNVGYWIAAQGCPKILMSPAGWVETLGLSMEPVYVKELLANLGITAEMINIGTYKDAAEPLTQGSMSDTAREAAQAILQGMHRVFIEGIAKGRKKDARTIQALIDNGPYDAKASLDQGLVDEIGTLESRLGELSAKYAGGVVKDYGKPPRQQVSFTDLMKLFGGGEDKADRKVSTRVALVPVVGPITGGTGDDLFGSADMVRERDLSETLSELERDNTVRAVVLRIDSPGGSALASDNIWHSVRALAKKKPVIASLGDVAASGGYYIASGATEIIAEPATLTGSIGVIGGKLVFREAASKMGIHAERLTTGRRASLMSPFSKFTDDERHAVEFLMTATYNMFVNRVAEGRGMPREKVLAVAEGRMWTGHQALTSGLVNQMGGLHQAVERARALASVPAGTPVQIVPEPKSLMEIIGEALSEPQVRVTQSLARRHPPIAYGLSLAALLIDEQVLTFAPTFLTVR